jgi:circadian clock protein KaiB
LYVAGQSPRSLLAFANLAALCEDHHAGRYEIDVVDVTDDVKIAESDHILVLPTLLRPLFEGRPRIVGDLSNTERVLVELQLRPAPLSSSPA